jgi:hypothetical protein
MTLEKLGEVRLLDIMAEANLNDIAPLTAALMKTLDDDAILAVQRFTKQMLAARREESAGFQEIDSDFVARQDAMLAGLQGYLPSNDGEVTS